MNVAATQGQLHGRRVSVHARAARRLQRAARS